LWTYETEKEVKERVEVGKGEKEREGEECLTR
jgi:hypothetical protein